MPSYPSIYCVVTDFVEKLAIVVLVSVMPNYANSGFQGVLPCGFLCLLSHLLLALLIYHSMDAVLLHMLLHAAPTFV